MNLSERKEAFIKLGNKIDELLTCESDNNEDCLNKFLIASDYNEWFTKEHILFSLRAISNNLSDENIDFWLKKYPNIEKIKRKRVGVVAAGNIPLVAFHDLLCVLIAGHELMMKLSSKDDKLMTAITDLLIEINPEFKDLVSFENEQLHNFDAIIATGSDNTAKYFEYYFGKYHNIIRKNRNSIAVLSGNESEQDLKKLADDIMMYFGLGCRNVSKLFLPQGYDIQKIFKHLYAYKHFNDHNKYANNYTYNKSIYLMNKVPFWENGFTILKEDTGMSSPISVVYFEYYNCLKDVKTRLDADKNNIQCIVANPDLIPNSVDFGEAQKPKLWDYADDIDTMQFLDMNNEQK